MEEETSKAEEGGLGRGRSCVLEAIMWLGLGHEQGVAREKAGDRQFMSCAGSLVLRAAGSHQEMCAGRGLT